MKRRIRLTEDDLHRIVENSVKRILRESYFSGGEYYEDPEEMYIGRTEAYYDYENESMYADDDWTYSEDRNDPDFAGEVYRLTPDGISALQWWLNCRRSNEWQRQHTFGHDSRSSSEMWDYLTDPKNGLSEEL